MNKLLLTLLLFTLPLTLQGKRLHLESWYQNQACPGGAKTLENRREVDCVTPHYAIEFDFAKKSYECVGQALYYAAKTGLKPGCVLIIEEPRDCRHLEIIHAINRVHPVHIQLWTTCLHCSQHDNYE